jgi:hypothetical protein
MREIVSWLHPIAVFLGISAVLSQHARGDRTLNIRKIT